MLTSAQLVGFSSPQLKNYPSCVPSAWMIVKEFLGADSVTNSPFS